jgi:phenylacetate-coenzyme A ligase PaaK-like adenylate-forming protein
MQMIPRVSQSEFDLELQLDRWVASRMGVSAENFSQDKIEKYHLKKLWETLVFVRENVPFYRSFYSAFSAVNTLDAFAQLPLINGVDVVRNGLNMLSVLEDSQETLCSIPTAGTAGFWKRVWYSDADLSSTEDFIANVLSWLFKKGDCVGMLQPDAGWVRASDIIARAVHRPGLSVFHLNSYDSPISFMHRVKEFKLCGIIGTPDELSLLARSPETVECRDFLSVVVSSADRLTPVDRATIEENWKCEVYDHYSMVEAGLTCGIECCCHDGFHIREADLYVEAVDCRTGFPVPDGENGEIVLTTLGQRAMPLIRYRTGDIGPVRRGRCLCGSVVTRVGPIVGRACEGLSVEYPKGTRKKHRE